MILLTSLLLSHRQIEKVRVIKYLNSFILILALSSDYGTDKVRGIDWLASRRRLVSNALRTTYSSSNI